MGTADRFLQEIIRRFEELPEGQRDAIHEAGVIMADTIQAGGIIRAYGSGHSYGIAQEICGRVGGYIQSRIIREPSTGIYEVLDGTGDRFWKRVDLHPEDCLVVISNSGRNPFPIELCAAAQAAGVKTIAITAVDVSRAGTSRSKTGKLLCDVADVVLDNKSSFGDSALDVEGIDAKVGATSLFTGSMLADLAMMESMDILLERGVNPPVFKSNNIDGGQEYNDALKAAFRDRLVEY